MSCPCGSGGCGMCDPDEELTRPDHIAVQNWRRLISAYDAVPADKREFFLEAVAELVRSINA